MQSQMTNMIFVNTIQTGEYVAVELLESFGAESVINNLTAKVSATQVRLDNGFVFDKATGKGLGKALGYQIIPAIPTGDMEAALQKSKVTRSLKATFDLSLEDLPVDVLQAMMTLIRPYTEIVE